MVRQDTSWQATSDCWEKLEKSNLRVDMEHPIELTTWTTENLTPLPLTVPPIHMTTVPPIHSTTVPPIYITVDPALPTQYLQPDCVSLPRGSPVANSRKRARDPQINAPQPAALCHDLPVPEAVQIHPAGTEEHTLLARTSAAIAALEANDGNTALELLRAQKLQLDNVAQQGSQRLPVAVGALSTLLLPLLLLLRPPRSLPLCRCCCLLGHYHCCCFLGHCQCCRCCCLLGHCHCCYLVRCLTRWCHSETSSEAGAE